MHLKIKRGIINLLLQTTFVCITPLPNKIFFDWTKFKAFADEKLNVGKMETSGTENGENAAG